MNLYEINMAIEDCIIYDEATGEVLGIDEARLAQLEGEREAKIEAIALYIKDDEATAAAIRDEERKLAARRQRLERKAESLSRYLSAALDGEKFSTARCEIKWRTVNALDIADETALSRWLATQDDEETYLRYKEPEINKTALRDALKHGIEIPGCQIVQRKSMSIK